MKNRYYPVIKMLLFLGVKSVVYYECLFALLKNHLTILQLSFFIHLKNGKTAIIRTIIRCSL